MDLVLYPSFIYFPEINKEDSDKISELFSVSIPGHFFIKKKASEKIQKSILFLECKKRSYAENKELNKLRWKLKFMNSWDGKNNYYNKKKKILPIGFLSIIESEFKIDKIADMRECNPIYDFNFTTKIFPSPRKKQLKYQIKSICNSILHKNGIFDMSMASGKTFMFIMISRILYKNNVLILTDKVSIFNTILSKFDQYLDKTDVGIISSDEVKLSNEITVAMIQTLSNRIKKQKEIQDWYKTVNVVLIDECHHCISSSYQKLLKMSRARIRFGFSGTIPKEKTKEWFDTIQYIGTVIDTLKPYELIDMGLAAKPIIKILKSRSIMTDRYQDSLKYNVIYNPYKILSITNIIEKHKNEKILIVSDFIPSGRIVSKTLTKLKYKNNFLYSGSKNKKQKLKDFESGKTKILIATSLIDEGVDVADVSVIILAFPRKSYRQVLQRIGRGMRITEDKDSVIIYDFLDDTDKYLKQHFKERKKYYIENKFEDEEVNLDNETDQKTIEKRLKIIEKECMSESKRSNKLESKTI